MSDAINKPAHYNQGSIECIEAMKIVLTPEEFRGYLKGNVFKYIWREKDKNGNEDIRKGKSYYDWLIELIDESEKQKAADLQSLKDHPFGKLKEPVIKQSLNTEPPDGWRFLEVGEVIRNGDTDRSMEPIPKDWIGSVCRHKNNVRRRNKFEAGEKVVHVNDNPSIVYTVDLIRADGAIIAYNKGVGHAFSPDKLAPYIEDAKPTVEVSVEVTGEVKNPLGCPDGWRFLKVGEVIRKGDRCFTNNSGSIDCLTSVGEKFNREAHYPIIRRNRFNVGEIVVHVNGIEPCEVVGFDREKDKYWITSNGNQYAYESKWLAPYIEETK